MKSNNLLEACIILIQNPKLFLRYVNYKIKRKSKKWKNAPTKKFRKIIGGIKINYDFKNVDYGEMYLKQIYFDEYEMPVVEMIKRYLKPGDTFIDVGANIGYITAVAANEVGENGEVHTFEPVPIYFHYLEKIAIFNKKYKIFTNKVALGNKKQIAKMQITLPPHTGGSSLILNNSSAKITKKIIKVPVVRLDDYIKNNSLSKISLIKIDVEGFEFQVLQGLENYLNSKNKKPVIIMEFTQNVYGSSIVLRNFENFITKHGYTARSIYNYKKHINIRRIKRTGDILLVPNNKLII